MSDKQIDVQMGGAFKPIKLHKQLLEVRHTMKNLSHEDLNAFEEIVGKHARMVSSGTEFSRSQKLALKHDLMKLPTLSRIDKLALKNIINTGM